MKKLRLLLAVSALPFLLTSCDDEGELFLSNFDYFCYGKADESNPYLDVNVEDFRNLMNTDVRFVVYFDDPTCNNCKNFAPIMQKYAKENETLIARVKFEDYETILNTYSANFDRKDFTFPYVGVMKGNSSCSRISNKKYMQTEKAFFNYMEDLCKNSNIYYTNKDVTTIKNNREFTHILVKNSEQTAISLYSTKVKKYIENSDKNIVFTNSSDELLSVAKIGPNYDIKEKTLISEETEPNLIANYF